MPIPTYPNLEHLSEIILNAVREHHRQLGTGSLALVLKGSKSKLLLNRKLYESRFFGALFYYPIKIIEIFIKQLIEKKMINVVLVTGNPYPLPMLELAPEGNSALESKAEISLVVRQEIKPIKLNDSIRETFRAFSETRDIAQIALKRNLAESTIWKHLTDLVKLGQLSAMEIVSQDKIKLILEAKENNQQFTRLKEFKEILPPEITYEEIRCVLAEDLEKT